MKLINNWRQGWRFSSVRLQLLGAAVLTLMEGFPHAFVSIWDLVPAEIRAELPSDTVRWIGIAIIVTGTIARLIRQPRLHDEPGGAEGP